MNCVSEDIQFIDITNELEDSAQTDSRTSSVPVTPSGVAEAIDRVRREGEEVVVIAAHPAVATQVRRMAAALAENQLLTERLVDAMFAPGSTASSAAARQAQRNARARQDLIDEFGVYDSDEVADMAGSAASNRSATASRWLASGKIFAVNHRGARLYPRFQFGTDGHPRPVFAHVLKAFEPYGLDGWEIALWFTTATGWLDDQRPVDLLTREPEKVIEAARLAFEEVVA
jgi:hypothetical protein